MQTSWGLFNLARKEYYAFYPSGTKTVPSVALVGNTARPRRPARWTTIEKPNITAGVCYNETTTTTSSMSETTTVPSTRCTMSL